jgi:hypothetical protein
MVNKPLSLLAYCAILLVVTTNAFASPKEADPRWLILSVFNDASVPAEFLAQGEARAAHILAQTGIQVEWLNCAAGGSHVPEQFEQPSPCSCIAYPSHLSVRIVLAWPSVRETFSAKHIPTAKAKERISSCITRTWPSQTLTYHSVKASCWAA